MNKIVALVDCSAYAQSVCDHAGWIASHSEAALELVHVLGRRDGPCDNADLSGSIGLGARSALLEELAGLDGQRARLVNKRGRAILEDARDRATAMGATNVSTMLRNCALLEALEELEADADVIVVGKRGEHSHIDMEHLGTNLERVVRSTKKPVLVASRAFSPVRKLLVAFDGGTSSIKAVEHIASSSLFKGIECMLMQVGNDNENARKALWGAVAVLQEAGFTTDSMVKAGQPEKVIAEAVEAEHYDLLVMGAYGHSRIRNLIIGSTTTQMIRSCKVPIMLYR